MTPVDIFERLGFSPTFQGLAGLAWMGVVLFIMFRAEQNKRRMDVTHPAAVAAAAAVTPTNGSLARLADMQLTIGSEIADIRNDLRAIHATIAELISEMKSNK